jgi:hypothetical protein
LGFFYADGSISSVKNRISIGLQTKDIEVLNYYNNELMHTNIKYIEHCNSLHFRFTSKQIKNDLMELGIVNNKTYSYTVPDYLYELTLDQKISWLWGFICGDGSISKRQKAISFINHKSSEVFLDNLLLSVSTECSYGKYYCENSVLFTLNKKFTLFLAENIKNLVEKSKMPILLERKYKLLMDKLN